MRQNNFHARKFIIVGLIITMVLTLASCLPGDIERYAAKPAGFFMGIWHGWMAPISLIVRLFNPDTRIYEVNNTGWWYDFGFYMAIISGFGGLSLGRRSKKHDSKSDS